MFKITIERKKEGLFVNFDTDDWDEYEAMGMLEMAKTMIGNEAFWNTERKKSYEKRLGE